MKRTLKVFFAVCAVILFAGVLMWVNQDLFHYRYAFLGGRTFNAEEDGKGDYFLTEEIALKPADYALRFTGKVTGPGSAVFLRDRDGENLAVLDLRDGVESDWVEFRLEGVRSARLGVSFDPIYSVVDVDKLEILSDHVLYKSSLTRHGTVSVVLLLLFGLFLTCLFAPERWRRFVPIQGQTLAFLLGLTAMVCSPYFLSGTYIKGEDLFFHLSRIEGIAEGLRQGYFPVRDQLFWLKNWGYGAGFFYPDLLLYFSAGMRLLGFSLMSCYETLVVLVTFLGLASYYYAGKRIGGKALAGCGAAMFAAFSAYRLGSVYYRAALGEIQSFFFAPWIVLGLYEIFHGREDRWYYFAFGFWGLVSSHLISIVLAAGLVGGFCLIRARTILTRPKILCALILSVLTTAGGCAYFLLPMAEQSAQGGYLINTLMSSYPGGVALRALSPWRNLFTLFHDWSYGADFTRVVYPGWAFLSLPLVRLLVWKRRSRAIRTADVLLAVGVVLTLVSTDLFPWIWLQWLLNRIQFTWRLLLPASVLFALCGGIYFAELFSAQLRMAGFLCVLALNLWTGLPILRETVVNRSVPDDLFIMQDNRVCGAEYMPWGLGIEFIDKNGDTVFPSDDRTEITYRKRTGLRFVFDWVNGSEETAFRVPFIYYKGFRGEICDGDSCRPLDVGRSKDGMVLVNGDGLSEGTIRVWYTKTRIQIISELITVLTCLGIVFSWLLFRRRRAHG